MISKLREWWEPISRRIFQRAASLNPNYITLLTPLFGGLAGYCLYLQNYKLASLMILLSGVTDLIDGAIARAGKKETRFGAILDSTCDRLSEGLIYAGASPHFPIPASLALLFSYLVSYIRAKDDRIRAGIAERGERILLLTLFVFFGKLREGLWLITLLAGVTVIQRLLEARKLTS